MLCEESFAFVTYWMSVDRYNDMKAKRNISKIVYRLCLSFAVILSLACTSCSENPLGSIIEEEVLDYNGNIITEFFKVQPAGSTIHAFGGDVILDFPRGTLPTPTRYKIVSFPIEHLDLKGNNVMMRAFSLENVTNKSEFSQPVTILIRYDLCGFNMCQPGENSDMAIFKYLGDQYAFHKLEELGECCMNCSCKTVMTCIEECGAYIVVEK